jgi:hypothetical protein
MGRPTFGSHLKTLFSKRFNTSKRNWRGLLIEVFIPALLILIGFGFSKIQLYFNSPERPITPALLPWKQRILVNSKLVRTSEYDIPIQSLIESLPSYDEGAFEPTYRDYSYVNTDIRGERALLQEFDQDVFDMRLEGPLEPYRYGSYFVYEANNLTKQFKVASFLNLTS